MTVGPPAFHRRVWARFDADAREFRRSDATPGSFSSSERSSTVSGQEDGDARGLDRVVAWDVRGAKKGHSTRATQHPAG